MLILHLDFKKINYKKTTLNLFKTLSYEYTES